MQRRLLALACWLASAAADAHPMGNFSVSHYSRLEPRPGAVTIVYALDLAEIPTFEASREWNLDPKASNQELAARARQQMRIWVKRLEITANGEPLAVVVEDTQAVVSDGAGGMPVVRVTARLRGDVPAGDVRLAFADRNFEGRTGWKEVVIRPIGVSLTSGAASPDVSLALSKYPEDPAFVPPQQLTAELSWRSGPEPETPPLAVSAAAPPASASAGGPPQSAPGSVQKGDYLSTLLSRTELPWTLMLTGMLAAFGLGAMHALSPGHGKTLVAAYLVGSRGTMKHAAFLGATVTFTHTISVFCLGLATLFLSQYILPEKIVPWLGAISGCSIILLGLSLLQKRWAKLTGRQSSGHHPHHHSHGGFDHSHDHDHEHSHEHGSGHHHHLPQGEVTLASLIALGVSGGLVPCPTALVLLLSAIAIGRTAFGLALLVAFSCGLAVVLVAIGCLVLYAKTLLPQSESVTRSKAFQFAPVLSAIVIVGVGIVLTGTSIGVFRPIG